MVAKARFPSLPPVKLDVPILTTSVCAMGSRDEDEPVGIGSGATCPLYRGERQPMNAGFWFEVLATCQQIQQVVAPRLLAWAGQSPSDRKADGSLVTRADLWADQQVTEMLRERFPHHGCLSEEGNHTYGGEQWCWIIDPIDGTTNYSHGLPIWCIALGLLYQGTPVFGYVHVPGLQQTFHGFYQAPDHANGAYLNEKPIRVKVSEPNSQTFF